MSALADAWGLLDEHMADFDQSALAGDIDQPELANRMLRRVMRERRLFAEDEALVQAEKDHLDAFLERSRAAHDTSFLEMQLQRYHEARLERDPKAKTIHLPSGTLVARKRPDHWEFDDEAFLEWAKTRRTDLVRTKEEVDRTAVKKALIVNNDGRVLDFDSGEFVESVTVTPGEIAFSIKGSEDD